MMKTTVTKSIQITTKNNREKFPIPISLALCLLIVHSVLWFCCISTLATESTGSDDNTKALAAQTDSSHKYKNPEIGMAHECKNHALSAQQYQQILEKLNKSLVEKGNSGEIYFRRAFIYKRMHKYKNALSDCDAAIACNFDNARVRLLKGEALFDLKRYQEAMVETNKSIALDDGKARSYSLRAKINEFLQFYGQALQDISRAINLDTNNASNYEIRAQIAYKVEEYERCIQDADTAIKLNPHSNNAYIIRSQAYEAKNDPKQAKQDKIKARELARGYKEDQF